MNPLEIALAIIARGWKIIPVDLVTKQPARWNGTRLGIRSATDDPELVTRWFADMPEAGVGIVCRASGLAVIDADLRHGADISAIDRLIGDVPTFAVDAPDGMHRYFQDPGLPKLRGQLDKTRFPGHDIKLDGYVLAAGNIRADGGRYAILTDDDPAPMPDALLAECRLPERPPNPNGSGPTIDADALGVPTVPELLSGAGWALHSEHGDETWWTRPGKDPAEGVSATHNHTGHDTLKVFSTAPECSGMPTDGTITRFGVYTYLHHGGDFRAARATLEPESSAPRHQATPSQGADADVAGDISDTAAIAPDGYRLTDAGNARRLVDLCPGCFRYAHAWQRWLVYRRGVWTIDEGDALITEQAKGVARGLFKLAITITDSKVREWIFKWAGRSESSGAIAAMVRLARGIPGVIVEHEQLDANPHQLNVLNGTIDLHTGELRPHDPADLCTKQAPVVYDQNAEAPLWQQCLDTWQSDTEMRAYLQLEAGAAATGKHTETLSVHFGTGGNGKSKFFGAIQHVLGDYTVEPHKSLLVASRHEQHETVRADMFRIRLGVASETKAADVLDDEQVKAITGGDRLRCRRMREDRWSFWPSHTLVMFSNYRPRIQGRDEAIWRRLRLVPWTITIPENERDRDLGDKLKAEAPGILNWIITGAMKFLAEGFDPPDTVRAATADYRANEDHAGRFVTEALHIGDGWAWSSDIVDALQQWAREQGVDPAPDMREIAGILKKAGCTNKQRRIGAKRGVVWTSVTLEIAVEDETDTQ